MEGIVDFFTNGIWGILAAAVGIIIYIIPTIIALSKRHSQRTGIILLNIFLGWTLAGWLGAFIWALAKD
ncbi:MAG: superinfection immunity protein [Clostridiales bacterium]|nr:superinfection immunity protein [Clostridiales bacterium]